MSQFIQTYVLPNIGSILLFFVTLGLLYVTSRYMRATRAMADVMKREQDIKLVPLSEQLTGYEVKCWDEKHEEKPVFPVIEKSVKFIAPKDYPTRITVDIPLKELYKKTGVSLPQKIKMLTTSTPPPQKTTVGVETTFNFLNAGISPFSQSYTFFKSFP